MFITKDKNPKAFIWFKKIRQLILEYISLKLQMSTRSSLPENESGGQLLEKNDFKRRSHSIQKDSLS